MMDEYILKSQAITALSKYDLSNGGALGHHSGAVECAIAEIEAITPADAVPVVHGRWFLLDECSNAGVYCSACRKKVYKENYANQKLKSKYCPNCGARMDLEVDGDG